MLLALCNIPFMQNWGAKTASGFLAEKLQTKVEIERIKLGIFNRVIVDGVKLYDKQDTLMLDIARLAAKVEILPLLKHKIRIDNAQLFGAKAYHFGFFGLNPPLHRVHCVHDRKHALF